MPMIDMSDAAAQDLSQEQLDRIALMELLGAEWLKTVPIGTPHYVIMQTAVSIVLSGLKNGVGGKAYERRRFIDDLIQSLKAMR